MLNNFQKALCPARLTQPARLTDFPKICHPTRLIWTAPLIGSWEYFMDLSSIYQYDTHDALVLFFIMAHRRHVSDSNAVKKLSKFFSLAVKAACPRSQLVQLRYFSTGCPNRSRIPFSIFQRYGIKQRSSTSGCLNAKCDLWIFSIAVKAAYSIHN